MCDFKSALIFLEKDGEGMAVNPFKKGEGKALVYASYQRLLDQWGIPIQEEDVATEFGQTHLITAGESSNPPLLLFHGVGDNSALMWIYNISELSKHFYVIAVDTMGGPGKSEPNNSYNKSFDQAIWIDQVLQHFSLDMINIAGVSNGSYLASYYTITNPAKVNKMIGLAGGVKVSMLKMMMLFLPEALLPSSEKTTRKLLRKLCAPDTSVVFEENQEIMSHWTYLLKYYNNRSMMFHKYKSFTLNELSILKEKALYLIGEHDRLSNYPAAIEELDRNQISYKIIPNAGHGINHEQASRINQEIINYVIGSNA
ncbi:alpha/beta fold hydrolase [Paenibacillus sp. S150]|uniref:alpha/beta fold hydrolase n=1 Tax=Paenibacillus sp. S150 TaxID=2749826 RepID=UPI001E2B0ACC|nr:alpha/beta fold hydrolase [Paenibacillus sp. S150]